MSQVQGLKDTARHKASTGLQEEMALVIHCHNTSFSSFLASVKCCNFVLMCRNISIKSFSPIRSESSKSTGAMLSTGEAVLSTKRGSMEYL